MGAILEATPTFDDLDWKLTAAMTRSRLLDDGLLRESRQLRERLRRGDELAAIATAAADLTERIALRENRGRRKV